MHFSVEEEKAQVGCVNDRDYEIPTNGFPSLWVCVCFKLGISTVSQICKPFVFQGHPDPLTLHSWSS